MVKKEVSSVKIWKEIFVSPSKAMLKKEYLPLKTEKKISEKLLCVLLIHLTYLQLSPQGTVH